MGIKKQKVKVVTITQLERRLPLFEKTCPVCEKRFEGIRKAQYCSVNCANKASYARNREARNARRVQKYHASKG